jgi:RNA polymerase sigma-B factor
VNDEETLEAFRSFRASGDRRQRNELVERHRGLAVAAARRFRDRGEPLDDLTQVAMLGLVKAVERFDPDHGTPFAGFAMPTMLGEIRRHFRDATWSVHVPRRLKDVAGAIGPATERLRERYGRHPNLDEMAQELQMSVEDVIAGMEASAAYRASSLWSERSEKTIVREPEAEASEFEQADARVALERLIHTLPDRERTILYLRFYEEKSQSDIAAVVGTSQVHVSRLIRASLTALRASCGVDDLSPEEGDPT